VGVLATAAAILVALGSPQSASAGLLSELGSVDYDGENQKQQKNLKLKKLKEEQAQARSRVLDYAAQQATLKAERQARAASERERAAKLFQNLDENKKAEEEAEKKKQERAQSQRAMVLEQLGKNAATASADDEDKRKAAELFAKFLEYQKEKEAKEQQQTKQADVVRSTVLKSLEERKADAKKAAEEAEAIAKRIDQLAKNARETAALARQSAELLQ